MVRYSRYIPPEHSQALSRGTAGKETDRTGPAAWMLTVSPAAVVGFSVTAALMVLLLLTQARLSRIGFELSALEQELAVLTDTHEKLVVSYAGLYSAERVEEYAMSELGMIRPNPDQIYYIDIEPDETSQNRLE